MRDISSLVRENVKRLKPYSCARDEFGGTASVYLDANENPFGSVNRYPDPLQKEVKKLISAIRNVDEEMIFVGNGSDEVIDLCFRTFCNPGSDKVLIFPPTYGMYEVSAGVNDVEVLKVPLTGTFQIDIAKTIDTLEKQNPKLVFICSPNNPTGNSFKTEDILTVAGTSRGIVVVDEAYIDFSEKQSLLPLLNKFPNIVVMQTFSKAFGMAAIRAGMAFANKEIIGYFNKLKYPYNVSTLSQKAIIARLGRPHLKEKHVRAIIAERKKLERALARLNYVKQVYQSDANFLLVKVTDADLLYSTLLGSGIVTRNRNSIIDGCVRITVGTRKENRLLMEALKSIKL